MKKLLIACCVAGLVSCSNTNEFDSNLDAKVSKPSEPGTQPTANTTSTTPPLPALNPVAAPVTSQPVVTTSAPVPVTTQAIPAQQTTTAKGMNPPHGQPGHRCDIEVGAPLNSAPKTSAKTTSTTATPQNITVTPTTTQVKTAPGMNPAHGQPGHRCDIEVGAPLNSAPKNTATTTPVVPVKTEQAAPINEQWKVDIKDKPAKRDSSNN